MPELTAHDTDFYGQFCREVETQHIAADLPAAAVVGICTRAAHRAQRKIDEQQPEPVSRDEITDMFEAEFADEPTYVVVEQMLSRYDIYRKQQGDTDV